MGKAAKVKGARTERELVKKLKEMDYVAKRMPGSGAYNFQHRGTNLKADILVVVDGKDIKIECKSRRSEYVRIYELLSWLKREVGDANGVLGPNGEECITITENFREVFSPDKYYVAAPKEYKRTVGKLSRMKKLLGEADILAIKQDYKPWLFIKYD